MGLFQRALETYESHQAYTGNRVGSTGMAPVGHIVTRADLEITLDPEGGFVFAEAVDPKAPKIVIPATEASAGRTNAPCAHPLCEQLGYLLPCNEKKYQLYVQQLAQWAESEYTHPKLMPVLAYVRGGTIRHDLERCGLVDADPKKAEKQDKLLVRWRVQVGEPEACWEDRTLQAAYTRYTLEQKPRKQGLCMVTGQQTGIAEQHPKGVFSLNGNAKLISANDKTGFTYRGRFTEEWQAAQVGYEASQKAHSALRWLIQEQGVMQGGRVTLCWNPQGKMVVSPSLPFRQAEPVWSPTDYRADLRRTLESKKRDFSVGDGVVVAAFDAATTGRLAVTYYNELRAHDFLQRLHDWDDICCWPNGPFGIQSPGLAKIVHCAFGSLKTEKGTMRLAADERVVREQFQRLVACRLERAMIGTDVVQGLVNHASQLQFYDRALRADLLFTVCAVLRKYRHDRFKEEWEMALEPNKMDRSYQFGRLMAVLEKVERDTYENNEKREPNAIRMQAMFCRQPMETAKIVHEQLEQAYFNRHSAPLRMWYKNTIGEIMGMLSQFPLESLNQPLEASYLMGYYLQRSALYTKTNKNTEESEHEHTEE